MSDERDLPASSSVHSQTSAAESAAQTLTAAPAAVALAPAGEPLDELEDVDFLLEEIENKIAPLALA